MNNKLKEKMLLDMEKSEIKKIKNTNKPKYLKRVLIKEIKNKIKNFRNNQE